MQEIPNEAPLISKWMVHVRRMINCTYMVDGVEVRLEDHQIFTDNETIILYTSARHHSVKFIDMPEFLRHWVPKQVEGMPYYNHILEEAGITVPANSKLPAPLQEPTPEEQIKTMFVDFMKDMIAGDKNIQDKLNTAYLNLKDLKAGNSGEGFLRQANQIANIVDKMIKGKLSILQGFNLTIKILEMDKKKNNKKDEWASAPTMQLPVPCYILWHGPQFGGSKFQ